MKSPRLKLIIYISLVLLGVALALLFLFLIQGRNVRLDVSQNMTRETAGVITERFREVVTPVQRDLQLTRKWGQSGMIDLTDPKTLDDKFLPIMESQPILSGLILADSTGREYFLLRNNNSWVTRSAGPYDDKGQVVCMQRDEEGRLIKTWQEPRGYDPRERAWFKGIVAKDSPNAIHWTKPYQFFTTQKVGITASVRWQIHATGDQTNVAAFDIKLDDLYRFASGLKVTPNARVLLIGNDGTVMADAEAESGTGIVFIPLEKMVDSPAGEALQLWQKKGGGPIDSLEFKCCSQKWWAGFQPLTPGSPGAWIAVVIPEADLLENFRQGWMNLIVDWLAILVVGGAIIVFLIHRYEPKHELQSAENGTPEIESTLKTLLEAGEGPQVEFKSTIRTNLKTGETDKAIEIAWLKAVAAFLNSDGGTLLIGVDDDANILGVEPDGFENHDKIGQHIKNLINQHIGPEFSPNIRCDVQPVRERTVVMLTCESAQAPVFFSMGKKEDFYIRSGPSSVRLSMSQMVKYLEQKK
jgi:hypothetical protein